RRLAHDRRRVAGPVRLALLPPEWTSGGGVEGEHARRVLVPLDAVALLVDPVLVEVDEHPAVVHDRRRPEAVLRDEVAEELLPPQAALVVVGGQDDLGPVPEAG